MRSSSVEVSHYLVDSAVLGNTRSVWIQRPQSDAASAGLAVFLDGEFYLTHFRAPMVMASLQDERAIPPTWCVYVDACERTVRWGETLCNPDFVRFLCDELIPQVEDLTGATADRTLAGISLTGLCAAYVALSRPGSFQRVLCQSGSFWWERGALSRRIGEWAPTGTAFRITVGDEETDTHVDHGHGLLQVESQIDGCRAFYEALRDHGYAATYDEFVGGHDIMSVRRGLRDELHSLFAQSTASTG